MTNPNNAQLGGSQWEACATGTLHHFSKIEQGRKFRRNIYAVGGFVSACCLLIAAIAYFPTTDLGPLPSPLQLGPSQVASELSPFGGMYCSEVVDELDSFLAGQTSDALRGPLKRHLQDCEKCRLIYEKEAAERGMAIAQQQAELLQNMVTIREHPTSSPLSLAMIAQ